MKLLQTFPDPRFDFHEEKLLREKDQVREKKVMVVTCLHRPTITHTNGDEECLRCHRMLKETKPKWKEEKDGLENSV